MCKAPQHYDGVMPKKKTPPNRKLLLTSRISVFVLALALFVKNLIPMKNPSVPITPIQTYVPPALVNASYSSGSKKVDATFDNSADTVTFSGTSLGAITLPRAMSGSGARYANDDESIVFWEHQGVLTVTQNDKTIFTGKINTPTLGN